MRKYKYLDDLGVERKNQMYNWMDELRFDSRSRQWRKQRRKYGIDERYTWNWSDEYMDYIYIHLKMFNEVNIVDFDDRNFKVVLFEDDGKNKELSIQEAIDRILAWFEMVYYPDRDDCIGLIFDDVANNNMTYEEAKEEIENYMNEKDKILHLFADIIQFLNW